MSGWRRNSVNFIILIFLTSSSVSFATTDGSKGPALECKVVLAELGSHQNGSPSAKKPSITPEQFVASIESEERPLKLIASAVTFALLPDHDQVTVIKSLIEKGRELPLAILVGTLKGENKATLLRFMATEMPQYVLKTIVEAKELPPAEKYALIEQAVGHSDYGQLSSLYSSLLYSVRPIAVRYSSFGMRAFAFAVRTFSRMFPSIRRFTTATGFDKIDFVSDEQKAVLFRHSLQHDPLSLIMTMTNADIMVDTPLHALSEPSDLGRTLKVFSEQYPELFPKEWLNISTDNISQREVSLGLIRALYRLSGENGPWVVPTNALDTVCRSGGLDYSRMTGVEYSEESLTKLYEVILDTQTQLKTPAYSGVRIEDALLRQRKLTALNGLFLNLKNLLFLRGFNQEIWAGIRREFSLDTNGITSSNINSLVAETQRQVSMALQDVLQRNSTDSSSALSLEQFQSLQNKWIDTETVLTLMARYNSTRAWRPEIKVLMKMLRAEVDGNFLQLKRHGDPRDKSDQEKATAQMAVLNTKEKQDAWWGQWNKVALFEPAGSKESTSDTERNARALGDVKQEIATSVLPAFADAPAPSNAREIYQFVISSKEAVNETIARLKTQGYQGNTIALALLENTVEGQTPVAEVQKSLGFIKAISRENPSLNGQFSTSLNGIFNKLKPLSTKQADQKKEIVVTSTSTSLRIALSIGALVDAGSCMNPVTGARADVIPSVALDGNIQAIFSTALNPNDFSSQNDFLTVVSWVSGQKPFHVNFEGDQSIYTFSSDSGPTVTTKPITHFYRRHQLKLGTGKGGIPVIRTERAFAQEHQATPIMVQQIKSIKQGMAKAMGGSADIPVTMAATRNLPGGTYSDTSHIKSGSGLKKSTYEIPSPVFQ